MSQVSPVSASMPLRQRGERSRLPPPNNLPPRPIRIVRTIIPKLAACPERIVDTIRRKFASVAAVWIRDRFRVELISTQLPPIIALTVIKFWRIPRKRVPRRQIARLTSVNTNRVVDPKTSIPLSNRDRGLLSGHPSKG